jgi:hypothetical protein
MKAFPHPLNRSVFAPERMRCRSRFKGSHFVVPNATWLEDQELANIAGVEGDIEARSASGGDDHDGGGVLESAACAACCKGSAGGQDEGGGDCA